MEETPVIEFFPEIEGLKAEKKKKVEKILLDEQKAVRSLQQQKRALFRKDDGQPQRGGGGGRFMGPGMQQQPEIDLSAKPEDNPDPALTPQQLEKARVKAAKIDEKIKKRIEKSNKKIAKQLTPEQYSAFLAKRGEFKFGFKRPDRQRFEGRTPREQNAGVGPPEN